MALWSPPDFTIGQALTGAEVDAFLNAVRAGTMAIDKDRIAPDAKFGVSQFLQQYTHMAVTISGLAYNDQFYGVGPPVPFALRRVYFKAPADGFLYRVDNIGGLVAVARIEEWINLVAIPPPPAVAIAKNDDLIIELPNGVAFGVVHFMFKAMN